MPLSRRRRPCVHAQRTSLVGLRSPHDPPYRPGRAQGTDPHRHAQAPLVQHPASLSGHRDPCGRNHGDRARASAAASPRPTALAWATGLCGVRWPDDRGPDHVQQGTGNTRQAGTPVMRPDGHEQAAQAQAKPDATAEAWPPRPSRRPGHSLDQPAVHPMPGPTRTTVRRSKPRRNYDGGENPASAASHGREEGNYILSRRNIARPITAPNTTGLRAAASARPPAPPGCSTSTPTGVR